MAFNNKRRMFELPKAKRPKIVNCKVCGRAYVETGNKMCRNCYEKEQEMQIEVMSYVRDHPDCTATEIMEALDVPPGVIRRMIQEGRFLIADIKDVSYPCSKCGAPIIVGHLCSKCQEETLQKINKVTKELAKKQAAERQAKSSKWDREKGMYIVEALGRKNRS